MRAGRGAQFRCDVFTVLAATIEARPFFVPGLSMDCSWPWPILAFVGSYYVAIIVLANL